MINYWLAQEKRKKTLCSCADKKVFVLRGGYNLLIVLSVDPNYMTIQVNKREAVTCAVMLLHHMSYNEDGH